MSRLVNEQQQQQRGRRLAYLVMPSYDWAATLKADPCVVDTLTRLELIPSALKGYCRSCDARAFRDVLEPLGFDVQEPAAGCGGPVKRAEFKAALLRMIASCSEPNDVFVVAYCGHGHQELFTRHSSLVFSDNKQASSVWLDSALRDTPASVYTILNCCTADGIQLALPLGSKLAPSSSLAVDMLTAGGSEPTRAGSRRVDVFSTSSTELQKGGRDGTLFARAFRSAAAGASLEDVQQLLRGAANVLSGGSAIISITVHPYSHSGVFLGPLLEEEKAVVATRMANLKPYDHAQQLSPI